MIRVSMSFVLTLIVLACNPKLKDEKIDILSANLDTTMSPRKDFFQYANGGWIGKNPIPKSESTWGIGQLVQNEIYTRLIKINETAAASNSSDAIQQKIGNFWTSGMDTIQIEKVGVSPLQPYVDRIASIKDTKSLLAVMADLRYKGVDCLMSDYIGQDDKDSESVVLFFHQGGIGLPNRDYFFNKDERSTKIRDSYKSHIFKMFVIAGSDSVKATAQAKHAYEIEAALAAASRKIEDLRDPYANYNKMSTTALNKLAPSIDWNSWLTNSKINGIDSIIIGQPEFFTALDKTLKKESIENWKDYLHWHLLRSYAPYMHKAMVDESFNFYGKTIRGADEIRPRWKRVLNAQENSMGEALGHLFVREYFNETAKKRYEDMVEDIRIALKNRIEKLDWMSDSTKQKAYVKLAAIKKKVGYPDKWKDFSALNIDKGPYVLNIIRANEWWSNYSINKLGKPVDHDQWDMTPQTYNAYYDPSNNEIVLPAGIFTVPGYRDEELDDAVVYGYAGASTIGHEITHGFDDQGRQYDAQGNLKEWWTKDDAKKFKARADIMVKQFGNYIPIDTAHINGEATLGENIADLGGILLGLDAFEKTEQFKKNEKISGLTPLQRYFLGYSLGWMMYEREAALANQLLTDVHSPAKYRVNGPFVSVDEFYTTFGINPGDPMFISDSVRVKIW